jgi:two-component system response regulator
MSEQKVIGRPVEILLVEDNPADAELARIGLEDGKVNNDVHVVEDGEEALAFLRKEGNFHDAPSPDLVLLDLNLPGLDGRDVLREIKNDPELKAIPVVVLTTSDARPDVVEAYSNFANAYMTKPVDFQQFHDLMVGLKDYWFTLVKLPNDPTSA